MNKAISYQLSAISFQAGLISAGQAILGNYWLPLPLTNVRGSDARGGRGARGALWAPACRVDTRVDAWRSLRELAIPPAEVQA